MSPIEYIDGCEINAAMNTIDNRGLNDRPLAMAYVPYQEFEDLYADDEALYNGTLFRKLNLPFVGMRNGK